VLVNKPNKDAEPGTDTEPRRPGARPGLVSVDDRIDEIAREALMDAKRQEEAKRQEAKRREELEKRKREKPST
jgi:hypothetical protein